MNASSILNQDLLNATHVVYLQGTDKKFYGSRQSCNEWIMKQSGKYFSLRSLGFFEKQAILLLHEKKNFVLQNFPHAVFLSANILDSGRIYIRFLSGNVRLQYAFNYLTKNYEFSNPEKHSYVQQRL